MKAATEKNSLLFLLLLATFFSLWNLGAAPLMEWDESRNGVSAIEMQENGDYLNLHYGGKVDDWSVKPPLFIWTVLVSFEVFGQNAFALRLPSAIASILSLFWIFQIIRLYRSAHFALLVGLILLASRGFLGPHVGRSGDYDALLLCFLLGGIYYFLRYLDFKFPKGIYWAALFWGLAFWVKGPAAFILFPGLFLYVLGRGFLVTQITNLRFWLGLSLFLGIIGIWIWAIHFYGATFTSGSYEGTNAIQRIFLNDIVSRFTDANFDQSITPHPKDYGFFFSYLDTRFNFWAYLFYPALLLLLISGTKSSSPISALPQKHPLLFLSCCLWISTALFLTFASTKHHWYMAPVLPFIGITMIYGLYNYWQQTKYLCYPLLLLTLSWQFYQFSKPPQSTDSSQFFQKTLHQQSPIYISSPLPKQDELLYLHFYASNVYYVDHLSELHLDKRAKVLFLPQWQAEERKDLQKKWNRKGQINNYLFLERKEEIFQ